MRVPTSGPEPLIAAGTGDRRGQPRSDSGTAPSPRVPSVSFPPHPGRRRQQLHIQTQSVLLGGTGSPTIGRGDGDSSGTPRHPWGCWHAGVGGHRWGRGGDFGGVGGGAKSCGCVGQRAVEGGARVSLWMSQSHPSLSWGTVTPAGTGTHPPSKHPPPNAHSPVPTPGWSGGGGWAQSG